MLDPVQTYLSHMRAAVDRMPAGTFGRDGILAEAAHDAYQKVADAMSSEGVESDHVLVIGRLMNEATRSWIASGAKDVTRLEQDMRSRYEEWESGR